MKPSHESARFLAYLDLESESAALPYQKCIEGGSPDAQSRPTDPYYPFFGYPLVPNGMEPDPVQCIAATVIERLIERGLSSTLNLSAKSVRLPEVVSTFYIHLVL